MVKQFIASIYLKDGKAVKSLSDDTVVSQDVLDLASSYALNEADAIMVFDLSDSDESHEQAIGVITSLCDNVGIPVYGCGNIRRMEDVKKLLYAGCKMGILNLSKDSSFEILKEVSEKFGKEKIGATFIEKEEVLGNKSILKEYVGTLFSIKEQCLKETASESDIPIVAVLPEISLDKMLTILEHPNVCGMAGEIINKNIKEIASVKKIASERGVEVCVYDPPMDFEQFKVSDDGLIPVVVQDYVNDEVLMVAYMNKEAYEKTCRTKRMTYYSRSRKELWVKGETSGHFQYLKGLAVDCDKDTLLAKVKQVGAACHTGNRSCFYTNLIENDVVPVKENPATVFEGVMDVIKDRKAHPKEGSYTNYLFDKGIDKILKKVGEEATEIVIAAKNPDKNEIKYEISDFLYHVMVLMALKGVTWDDITEELAKR